LIGLQTGLVLFHYLRGQAVLLGFKLGWFCFIICAGRLFDWASNWAVSRFHKNKKVEAVLRGVCFYSVFVVEYNFFLVITQE